MGGSMRFYTANEDEIVEGKATDVYFLRTEKILREKGLANIKVKMEFHSHNLPKGYKWAIFSGLEEVLRVLEGKPVNVWALPEGTVFKSQEPLMIIEGKYADIATLETPLLGILRHYGSISTAAARIKRIVGDKTVLFFGLRALHPVLQPMADRAAYIGGLDGVSGVLSEKYLGLKPMGTMPHALIIVFGKHEEAWKAFDEVMPEDVPRIALVDTFYDEREESLMAARLLKEKLYGVRLDTPSSRRGSMLEIAREVRWTLDIHGFKHVKIFISGGINEENIKVLKEVADGFGVGTSIAFPKSIDISADVVEVFRNDKWEFIAKRGKLPGAKQLHVCPNHIDERKISLLSEEKEFTCSKCGSTLKPVMVKYIDQGKLVRKLPKLSDIRKYVLNQIFKLPEP